MRGKKRVDEKGKMEGREDGKETGRGRAGRIERSKRGYLIVYVGRYM